MITLLKNKIEVGADTARLYYSSFKGDIIYVTNYILHYKSTYSELSISDKSIIFANLLIKIFT